MTGSSAAAALTVLCATLLCSVRAVSFYYALLPPFELTINASSALSTDNLLSDLNDAITEHLTDYAASFANSFQELALNVTHAESIQSATLAKVQFSGYAVFGQGSGSPYDTSDLYSGILQPAFYSKEGSGALRERTVAIPLSTEGLSIVVQNETAFFNPTFYYVPLPDFQVAVKQHNPVNLPSMVESLEQELEAHLVAIFRNASRSSGDSLFDIHLSEESSVQVDPFDSNTSLYYVNFTGAAVFMDTDQLHNYSMDSVFYNLIPLAFLSQYGYLMLVGRLNQTDAWNGLQGLKISVDNPHYEPEAASQGFARSLPSFATWLLGAAMILTGI